MRKHTRDTAKADAIGFTLERGRLAQELCDKGWSYDRIASEVDVSRYAIGKWVNQGLIKLKKDLHNKRKTAKVLMAQELINNKVPATKIAEKIGVHPLTLTRWMKERKIK